MNKGNIVDFAMEYFGIPRKEAINSIKQKGRCVFHFELLTQYFKDRKDAPIFYDIFKREKEQYINRHRTN